MSTKLDETPKEKLANATRAQQRCEWALRAASDALRQFDASHKVLDATLSIERHSLVKAEAQAAEALREAKDNFNFAHHEHFAMSQNWGRSSGKWWRNDKRYEDRG
jgi:hypothetical protein